MTTKLDGGAAFPRPAGHNGEPNFNYRVASDAQSGMTLRDWFAGHALVGMISNGATVTVTDKAKTAEMILASAAYTLADAMLKTRA